MFFLSVRDFNKKFLRPVSRAALAVACLALSAASCGGESSNTPGDAGAKEVKRGLKPEADAEAAVIETDYGRIVIELYPNLAPKMVERFKSLIKEGFYDGTTFHRVNKQVVQGGDPNSKDDNPANDGAGDSPYPDLPAELSDVPFERGTVGAARQGERPAFGGMPGLTKAQAYNTANCQFYITLQRVPGWDAEYTVFGKVIEGMNNADIMAGSPTRPRSENPEVKIVMKRITLQPRANFK